MESPLSLFCPVESCLTYNWMQIIELYFTIFGGTWGNKLFRNPFVCDPLFVNKKICAKYLEPLCLLSLWELSLHRIPTNRPLNKPRHWWLDNWGNLATMNQQLRKPCKNIIFRILNSPSECARCNHSSQNSLLNTSWKQLGSISHSTDKPMINLEIAWKYFPSDW